MSLRHLGYVDLPAHVKPGGFDHAAVHRATARVYVAHTISDALDVIDGAADRYLLSIPGLTGVAGALVSEERDLVFTSNRGENTVGIFSPDQEERSPGWPLASIQTGWPTTRVGIFSSRPTSAIQRFPTRSRYRW